jgi:hypothetical protein
MSFAPIPRRVLCKNYMSSLTSSGGFLEALFHTQAKTAE